MNNNIPNPHDVFSGSVWPVDICARLYEKLKLERANRGKPTALRIRCRGVRFATPPAEPGKVHNRRWVANQNTHFCVDIQGEHLTSWVECVSRRKVHGEHCVESMPLENFKKIYLIDEKTVLHCSTGRYRAALGVGGGLTALSQFKWIESSEVAGEVISLAEWIPGLGEWAFILGVSASMFAAKRAHVVMQAQDVCLVLDMPQRAFHLMEALLSL